MAFASLVIKKRTYDATLKSLIILLVIGLLVYVRDELQHVVSEGHERLRIAELPSQLYHTIIAAPLFTLTMWGFLTMWRYALRERREPHALLFAIIATVFAVGYVAMFFIDAIYHSGPVTFAHR